MVSTYVHVSTGRRDCRYRGMYTEGGRRPPPVTREGGGSSAWSVASLSIAAPRCPAWLTLHSRVRHSQHANAPRPPHHSRHAGALRRRGRHAGAPRPPHHSLHSGAVRLPRHSRHVVAPRPPHHSRSQDATAANAAAAVCRLPVFRAARQSSTRRGLASPGQGSWPRRETPYNNRTIARPSTRAAAPPLPSAPMRAPPPNSFCEGAAVL